MPKEIIEDEDDLARSLFEPKDPIRIIDPALNLIELPTGNFQFNSDNDHSESINCLRLFGDDVIKKCHEEGLKKEANDNTRLKEKADETGRTPKYRTYIGYAKATANMVIECKDQYIEFLILHDEKPENYAHCNIKLLQSKELEQATNQRRKKFKNTAILKLKNKFSGFEQYPPKK